MNDLRHYIALVEGARAPLYHGTTFAGALAILDSGNIIADDKSYSRTSTDKDGEGFYHISLTRDPRLRYYDYESYDDRGQAPAVFVINQDVLRQRHEMKSYSYFGTREHDQTESEEQVITGELDINQLVTSIQLYSFTSTRPGERDIVQMGYDFDDYDEEKVIKNLPRKTNTLYNKIIRAAKARKIPIIDLRTKDDNEIMRHHTKANIQNLRS